ncbi:MAG: flavin-binding protein dodecin [Acidimicrobiales bacterium]|jgi:flavin-binding protein dodecin
MTAAVHGQVNKVVRVVGASPTSWEVAAQTAVSQASKTIQDLHSATLVEADLVLGDGHVEQYRVKLELSFQLDRTRTRISGDETKTVRVRRCLIIANQTLASPALRQIVEERISAGPYEFHVLVPEPVRTINYINDTISGTHIAVPSDDDRLEALRTAEERLDSFRKTFAPLESEMSGEASLMDPLAAARQVMEFSTFDEIIVSTLAPGASRWLKLDLPSRLERAFKIPVVSLISN